MQNYQALAAAWPSLSGSDIWSNLVAINALVTGQDAGGNDILWPQANGWNGPINQNDLVAAGIITDVQRIQDELSANLITQQFANSLSSGNV